MLSFEPEVIAARDAGAIDPPTAARLIAIERREIFSVHDELRALALIGAMLIITGVGSSLFFAAVIWILYSALEPSLRSRSPRMLVSWSRLIIGRFGDRLVAHDILIGIVVGISWNLWWRSANLSPRLFNLPALLPYGSVFDAFSSVRGVAFSSSLPRATTDSAPF